MCLSILKSNNVRDLVWLCQIEISRKDESMLYGYRQCYCLHINIEDIYPGIEKYAETWFDTSNYELDHYPKEKARRLLILWKVN